MKRFYCAVCKRVKRVRKLPYKIDNVSNVTPDTRIGVCNRHSSSLSGKVAYLHNLGVK